jgi:hypothetical protein
MSVDKQDILSLRTECGIPKARRGQTNERQELSDDIRRRNKKKKKTRKETLKILIK